MGRPGLSSRSPARLSRPRRHRFRGAMRASPLAKGGMSRSESQACRPWRGLGMTAKARWSAHQHRLHPFHRSGHRTRQRRERSPVAPLPARRGAAIAWLALQLVVLPQPYRWLHGIGCGAGLLAAAPESLGARSRRYLALAHQRGCVELHPSCQQTTPSTLGRTHMEPVAWRRFPVGCS